MPGRGPVPKLLEERRRGDRSDGPALLQGVRSSEPVSFAAADAEWHPIARGWYESLPSSGQSQYYEPSDWATAYLVAEMMHQGLSDPRGFSASHLTAVLRAMDELLITEGARRRARVELLRGREDEAEADPDVAVMEQYRRVAAV